MYDEKENEKEKNLTFGEALRFIEKGKLVCRSGWNGKGMFIFMQPEESLTVENIAERVKSLPDAVVEYYVACHARAKEIKVTPYLCMKAADHSIVNGWL